MELIAFSSRCILLFFRHLVHRKSFGTLKSDGAWAQVAEVVQYTCTLHIKIVIPTFSM